MSLGEMLAALGGAGMAAIAVKVLDVLAGRRGVVASSDVALSSEARAWAERFSKAMDDMAARHAVDIAALQARVTGLEARLSDREGRVRDLEAENARLEVEVRRLTDRVRVLEGGPADA